jgi:hypothetical protein
MKPIHLRRRRTALAALLTACLALFIYTLTATPPVAPPPQKNDPIKTKQNEPQDTQINNLGEEVEGQPLALQELAKLAIRAAASSHGYSRDQFLTGGSWNKWNACNTREKILARDLDEIAYDANGCTVTAGLLHDPYTGKTINFTRGTTTSGAVQIDHVVALSDAWKTGAQNLDKSTRNQFANDDLNLLAVDGPANMQKSDHNAAEWLPPNKPFRCPYIARQIAVKIKYLLWLTQAEHDAMLGTLQTCPDQTMPAM